MIAVAAMSENRVIGQAGNIPWHLSEDLKFFKRLTSGGAVVMGRKTYESIGRPLPNRMNIVLSRSGNFSGVQVVRNPEEIAAVAQDRKIFVIGGGEIYALLAPFCHELYLTRVHRTVEGDAFFPEIEKTFKFQEVVFQQPEFEIQHYVRA